MNLSLPLGTAAVLAFLAGAAPAQELDFENLPGVDDPAAPDLSFEDTDTAAKPECTTAFEKLNPDDDLPRRVYKCRKGNITITSENPPPGY